MNHQNSPQPQSGQNYAQYKIQSCSHLFGRRLRKGRASSECEDVSCCLLANAVFGAAPSELLKLVLWIQSRGSKQILFRTSLFQAHQNCYLVSFRICCTNHFCCQAVFIRTNVSFCQAQNPLKIDGPVVCRAIPVANSWLWLFPYSW